MTQYGDGNASCDPERDTLTVMRKRHSLSQATLR
jgi:hypothetical protein